MQVQGKGDGVADVAEAEDVEKPRAVSAGELLEPLRGCALVAPVAHGVREAGIPNGRADAGVAEAVGEFLIREKIPHVEQVDMDGVQDEADGHGRHPDLGSLEHAHRPPGKAEAENLPQVVHGLAKRLPALEGEWAPIRLYLLLQELAERGHGARRPPPPARDALLHRAFAALRLYPAAPSRNI